MSARRAALALAFMASLAACAPDVVVDEEAFARAKVKTVAVLPFTYTGEDPGRRTDLMVAAIREAFHRRFSVVPYLHLESEATDRILRANGLGGARALASATRRQIGEALGTDAFIEGEIASISNVRGGLAYREAIEGRVRLIDARTGRELLRIERTQTDVGGFLLESGQLVEGLHQTIDNSSDLGFLRLAEKWGDSVVKLVPAPPEKPPVAPPVIRDAAVVSSSGPALHPGDVVEVVVTSEPDRDASFDLGTSVADVPAFEEAPGVYRGHYRVNLADPIAGPLSVHVSDRFGIASSRVLRDHELCTAARPAAPRELTARREGAVLRLSWKAPGTGEARFRVYAEGRDHAPAVVVASSAALEATVPGDAVACWVAALDDTGAPGALARFEVPR